MKTLTAVRFVFENLRIGASLSVPMIALVISAEGLQHIAEFRLGMYQSQTAFHALQNHPLRLSLGVVKAIAMIAACYAIAKRLANHQGLPPIRKAFRAEPVRRVWDPSLGMTGLLASFLLAAPLIALHFALSYFAMGHSAAPLILALDSVLIGVLALIIGTSIWAGETLDHQTRLQPAS